MKGFREFLISELWNCDRVSNCISTKSAHMDLSFQNETQISENFSQQKIGVSGFDGF